MNNSRKNKVIKNIVISFLSKFLMFAIGIVIPRLVIVGYGSEINGLLTTVSNIYSYLALIQAGVGTAATQALYKPIAQKDREGISAVLVATKQYFRRLTKWYALGVAVFAVVYPFLVKTTIAHWIVFMIILINGFSTILTYWFLSTLQALLTADGKDYITQAIQFGVFILNSAVKICLLMAGINIVVIELAYLMINIVQILVYSLYIKKVYPWIEWKCEGNSLALNKRKHFLLNGVAWTVFNSTDTIIISTFCGLIFSSVYAMYNMIFANLNLVFAIFYNSIYFVLGQVYYEDREKYVKMHDTFESCISALIFGLLSVTYILILPFLKLYTAGVTDVNYIDVYLPVLFCFAQILSNCRMISGNLINLTNSPEMTNKASIAEVIINISLSIVLANIIGLHGVLIATVVALFFKTNYIIVISNRKLLNRSPGRTYLTICINMFLFFTVMFFTYKVDLNISGYMDLVMWGIVLVITIIPVYFAVNFIFNPKALSFIFKNKVKV